MAAMSGPTPVIAGLRLAAASRIAAMIKYRPLRWVGVTVHSCHEAPRTIVADGRQQRALVGMRQEWS